MVQSSMQPDEARRKKGRSKPDRILRQLPGFGPPLHGGKYYDLPPTHKAMAGQAADFCPIIPCVTTLDAAGIAGRPVGQISPDKSMNFHYTTPAFTVAPELRALLCCANSPRASALYAVSDRGLKASESRYARLPALGLPSDPTSRLRPCRRLVLVPMKRIVTINRVHVQGTCTP